MDNKVDRLDWRLGEETLHEETRVEGIVETYLETFENILIISLHACSLTFILGNHEN